MRHYVLVILKTGPTPMAKGKVRDAMFQGHFANIARLAKAGKLALAGPFDDNPGCRASRLLAIAPPMEHFVDALSKDVRDAKGDIERR